MVRAHQPERLGDARAAAGKSGVIAAPDLAQGVTTLAAACRCAIGSAAGWPQIQREYGQNARSGTRCSIARLGSLQRKWRKCWVWARALARHRKNSVRL